MALFKLGAFAQALTGKSGNTVFSETKSGTTVRDYVIPTDPRTAEQLQARANLTKATHTYRLLSPANAAKWEEFASTKRVRTRTGKLRPMNGINAFVELAAKMLQFNPNATLPTTPPLAPFTGDALTLTATASAGKITLDNSAANSAGVTTEILLQPLASRNRKPRAKAYKHYAFQTFTVPSEDFEILVPAGYYSVAYRFLKVGTGQATELRVLPIQTVTVSVAEGGSSEEGKRSRKAA